MPVDAVSTTKKTTDIEANPIGYTTRAPKQVLNSDDFMKLLSAQMANQDPMKPMEDTAFVSQMASFSSLAQMNQLTKDFGVLAAAQTYTSAYGLLGRTVTVTTNDVDAPTVTGVVEAIDTTGETPQIKVNGSLYELSTILSTQLAAPQAAQTSG